MDLHSYALREESLENVMFQNKVTMCATVVDINVFAQVMLLYKYFALSFSCGRFAGLKGKLENSTSEYVLVKGMTMRPPDQQMKDHIPSGFKHVFLIRHPTLVYNSYRKARYAELLANNALPDGVDECTYDIEKHDVTRKAFHFFEYLHELWGHVRENIDPNPIVINSQDLLDNPERILTKFCELTGLPYHDSLL